MIQYLIFKEIQTTKNNNNTNSLYETACASISSINLEESLTSLEHEIKTIFEKNNIDVITDGSNLEEISSFRRKVVKLVCSQIMAKKYNLLPNQSYFSVFQFLNFSGAYPSNDVKLSYAKSIIKIFPALIDPSTKNGFVSNFLN